MTSAPRTEEPPLDPDSVNVARDPFLTAASPGPVRGSAEDAFGKGGAGMEPLPPEPHARPWTPWWMVVLGAQLPFVLFTGILFLFTYWHHKVPFAPWLVAILGADIVATLAWPPASAGRSRQEWFPLLACFMAIGMGILFGNLNCVHLEPWLHAQFLREHSDVLPSSDPLAFADAGILHFAEGTVLDTESSAGYRVWPYTYCAAPIVSRNQSSGPIGFWAVGIGCCDARGGFTCDDAEDSSVRSGLRTETHMLGHSVGHDVGDNFERAIRMAAAAHDMEAAHKPVLVVWDKNPESLGTKSWWITTVIFALLTLVALAFSMCCFQVLTRVRRDDHRALKELP